MGAHPRSRTFWFLCSDKHHSCQANTQNPDTQHFRSDLGLFVRHRSVTEFVETWRPAGSECSEKPMSRSSATDRAKTTTTHPLPTDRKLVLKKTQVTKINKPTKTANSAPATLKIVSEIAFLFPAQVQAHFISSGTMRTFAKPRMCQGPCVLALKSELCVQRAD